MDLAHFRILIHEFLNKDPDIVPEEDPLSVCGSGLRDTIAYSLLGGGVPYPEHRLNWSLDSVPIF